MKIYAISDLHLSAGDKPMDIFGGNWENYEKIIENNWKEKVAEDDVVLVCGDLCWAIKLEEAGPLLIRGIKYEVQKNTCPDYMPYHTSFLSAHLRIGGLWRGGHHKDYNRIGFSTP